LVMRALESLLVRAFKELHVRARQVALFEQPVVASGGLVLVPHLARTSAERIALGRRHNRVPHRERAHPQGSGYDSRFFLTVARNLSASAPSTMRWSNDSEKNAHVRMAITSSPSAPVRTLGRFSMAPSPRIAEVPAGMIGVPAIDPKTPGFVMEKVAPC